MMAGMSRSRPRSTKPSKPKRPSDTSQRHKTRLCIRNLPPSVSDHDLRQFLLDGLPTLRLTDCRILKDPKGRSRRVAFCGVADESMAEGLIARYHRTYYQTSRLVVEHALANERPSKTTATVAEPKVKAVEPKPDVRKEEYLAVMGVGKEASTTQRQFWANDDGAGAAPTETEDEKDSSSDESSSDPSDSEDDADPLARQEPEPKSDLDFLRAHQVDAENLDENDENMDAKSRSSDSSGDSGDDEEEEVPMKGPADVVDESEVADMPGANGQQPLHPISSRLFARNLPFTAGEEDLLEFLCDYNIVDCHLPIDDQKRPKGFGFLTFGQASDAERALEEMDGTDFQGRLLHLLPAKPEPSSAKAEDAPGSYKERQERERQAAADKNATGWSASFLRGDAVVDTLAERLGLRKSDILAVKDGMSSGDAAVRLALGETAVIEENREYFAEHGIDMEALVSWGQKEGMEIQRSKTSILVKNLPADTSKEDLLKVFGTVETPTQILLAPSRTVAVVEYAHGNDAKKVFRKLAYRRFKSVPLYLEWAPLAAKIQTKEGTPDVLQVDKAEDDEKDDDALVTGPTLTVYVKNLNFSTTEDKLREFFAKHVADVRAVRIPQKVVPVKKGEQVQSARTISMGYGFVEFGSHASAQKVIKSLQGAILEGHALNLTPSAKNGADANTDVVAKKKSAKLMVRNVPFQATRKELLQLFGSFGQLKKARLPKKFDGSHRGFAFIEYLTAKEAAAAMKALSRTHLYGRHLVIEWAAADEEEDDLGRLRDKAKRDVDNTATSKPKNKKIRFT